MRTDPRASRSRPSGDTVHDRSHTAHRLQTTLTPAQEAVAVSLRQRLLLPLDDLLAVVREFLNPTVSRSGLEKPGRFRTEGGLNQQWDRHKYATGSDVGHGYR